MEPVKRVVFVGCKFKSCLIKIVYALYESDLETLTDQFHPRLATVLSHRAAARVTPDRDVKSTLGQEPP